jgi:hypothetical protein
MHGNTHPCSGSLDRLAATDVETLEVVHLEIRLTQSRFVQQLDGCCCLRQVSA